MIEITPDPSTDTPAGILLSQEMCGTESVTFFITLTADGNGEMYDTDGDNPDDPIGFRHTFGETIKRLIDSRPPTVDLDTVGNERKLWIDYRDETATVLLPAELGEALYQLELDLEQIFWDEINDQLDEDALLADGALDDEPDTFEQGDQETFDRAVILAQACWLRLHPRDDFMTEITSDEDGYAPNDATPDELRPLIDAIDYVFGPTGGTHEYNDGSTGRRSGYSYCPNSHTYESSAVREALTVRELIEAPKSLIELLAAFKVDPREYTPDLFGIVAEAEAEAKAA